MRANSRRVPFGEGPDDAEMTEGGLCADDNHIHFGGGQTEVTLDLAPARLRCNWCWET